MVSITFKSGRLTFEYIDPVNLIEGRVYYIKKSNNYIKDRLQNKQHLRFHTLYGSSHHYYYQLISKKHIIQETIEARSLNIILKMITGDETFKW